MGLTSLAIKSTLNSSLSDKKKSIILATIFYCILLCILYLISFWPPSNEELLAMTGGGGGGGVTVNFGDTDLGSGANFDSKELDIKSNTKLVAVEETPQEDIISQDSEADKTDVVIPKNEPVKNPKVITKPEVVKPVEVKKPVERKVDDAVANLLKGNKKGGDGNSKSTGNQGRANGDINSKGYSGNGGSGGGSGGGNGGRSGGGTGGVSGGGIGSGYSLSGRKALTTPKPENNCGNEYGVVVVKITVDKNGNAIDASPGYRGTTNSNSCLMNAAKKAALKTKWDPSPDGTEKQVGTIFYNFGIKD